MRPLTLGWRAERCPAGGCTLWRVAVTHKHSAIHPTLRSDRATLPWKRRRRIEFASWPRLMIDASPTSTAMVSRWHPLPAVGESSDAVIRRHTISDAGQPACGT